MFFTFCYAIMLVTVKSIMLNVNILLICLFIDLSICDAKVLFFMTP